MLFANVALIKTNFLYKKIKDLLEFVVLHFVVLSQMWFRFAAITAIFAVIVADSGMWFEVHFQCALFGKSFTTKRAFKRFDSFMEELMNIKSIARSEGSLTVLMRTFEQINIFVNGIDVLFENGFVDELLVALIALDALVSWGSCCWGLTHIVVCFFVIIF